jgi:hypothetical protein
MSPRLQTEIARSGAFRREAMGLGFVIRDASRLPPAKNGTVDGRGTSCLQKATNGRVRLAIAVKYRRDVPQRHRGKAAVPRARRF